MKNETFTPERIKAEADAFFEWDGEDRSLVTTTSCLLFAQHIAELMQARAAQPAPVVQEEYVLVPVEPTEAMWGGLARDLMMWLDFGNPTVEALRKHLSMLGREWPAWMDGESGMKGSGVPSKGTRATLIYKAMLAAASAQGQQVEWRTTAVMLEQANAGLAQLNGKLRTELSALKAQQEPVAWRVTGAGGLTVTPEYPKWAEDDSRLLIESLYTAPQPAPAQDVAGLASSDPVAKAEFETRLRKEFESRWPKPKGVTWGAGINDYCVSEFAEGIALSYPDMWMAYKAGAMRTNQ